MYIFLFEGRNSSISQKIRIIAIENKECDMEKKLYKVEDGKMLFGVCTGIGRYFNVDPTIIRLLWVCSNAFYGVGAFAYVMAAIILPTEDTKKE